MHTEIKPSTVGQTAAKYAHAILTENPTRWVHTSGVIPVAADGSTPVDAVEQAQLVWANIAAMLAEAGMGPADVIATVSYIVVGSGDVRTIMGAREAYLGGRHASSTVVPVQSLVHPDWLVEVSVIAAQ